MQRCCRSDFFQYSTDSPPRHGAWPQSFERKRSAMPNRLNYRILVIIAFMQGMVFYRPIATIYRRAYGLDIQGLFLIESISWLVTIVLEAPWGRFTDRYGYRKTLLLGNLAFLISKIVFSFASGFPGFLAERLILSVSLAALSGSSEGLVYCLSGRQDPTWLSGVGTPPAGRACSSHRWRHRSCIRFRSG